MDIDYNTKKMNITMKDSQIIKNYLSLKEINIYTFNDTKIHIQLENCLKLKKITIFNVEKSESHIDIINCPLIVNLDQIHSLNNIEINMENYNSEQMRITKNINVLSPPGDILLQKNINITYISYNNQTRHLRKNKISKIFMKKGSHIDHLKMDQFFVINGKGTINLLEKNNENRFNNNLLFLCNDKTNFDNIYIKRYIGQIFTNIKKCHFIETDSMYKNTEVVCDIFLLKHQKQDTPIIIENVKTKILIINRTIDKNKIIFNNVQCDTLLILSQNQDENQLNNITYNKLYKNIQINDFIKTDEFLNIDDEQYTFNILEKQLRLNEITQNIYQKQIVDNRENNDDFFDLLNVDIEN